MRNFVKWIKKKELMQIGTKGVEIIHFYRIDTNGNECVQCERFIKIA